MITAARGRGRGALLGTYARLSGPGWLQSAITLGGGSLAGSLYLGVLGGTSLMWLQPLAMLMGVIMLSAIGYVTLSTGERPFGAINRHVNPVLGWGWAIATLLANVVWCLPQFALGTAAVQQNLLPSWSGDGGKVAACAVILTAAVAVVWVYDTGARGVKLFETLLKCMVAVVVISFFGVVAVMSVRGGIEWGAVWSGFVPDISLLWSPAATFDAHLAQIDAAWREFWTSRIVADQRNVMVTAAATAVGINMTFLLPYSMLARGWGREFRGLAMFDLGTGLLIPFVLATSCVVIASSAQFHARADTALMAGADSVAPALIGQYDKLLDARLQAEGATEVVASALPQAERAMASMLVRRDAFDLAEALSPLCGDVVAQYVFGIGVLGMAISTVIMLMLISGFAVCEMLGLPPVGRARRLGSLLPAVGVLGPFLWQGEAKFWLAVPTSVFGMMLLPIAYLTFFLMLNSRALLGDDRPAGGRRVLVNTAALVALGLATFGAGWSVWSAAGWIGVGAVALFLGVALAVHTARLRRAA